MDEIRVKAIVFHNEHYDDAANNDYAAGFCDGYRQAAAEKQQPAAPWFVLSNKSDCGDLSIYKVECESEDEARQYMKALMIEEAAMAHPGNITQFMTSGTEGYIRYIDEERSDYRIVRGNEIVNILENDGVRNANLDALPDEFDMTNEEVDYTFYDIGRDEGR